MTADKSSSISDLSITLNLDYDGITLPSGKWEGTAAKSDTAALSKIICRKYIEMDEIARGGMGKVMLWKDHNLQRVVASKRNLTPDRSSRTLQRFLEEGQITGQLEHPNIVPIYDMGLDEEEQLYFTMKYVKGDSLKDILRNIQDTPEAQKIWSYSRILQVFLNVCNAIDYAHSKQVIHRDLKPENIMIGNFGEVMVMDWGLAKVVGQGSEVYSDDAVTTLRTQGGFKTITGQISGTPLYMSPEQAMGKVDEINQRSDIYSLGAILYEMMTGKHLVNDREVFAILHKVSEGKINEVPKQGVWGEICREMKAILQKALAFRPEDRYATVRELSSDIQNVLDGKEVSACSYNFWHRCQKNIYRYRKEIGLIFFTGAFFLSGFWGWEWYKQQKESERYINHCSTLQNDMDSALIQMGVISKEKTMNSSTTKNQEGSSENKTNMNQPSPPDEEIPIQQPPLMEGQPILLPGNNNPSTSDASNTDSIPNASDPSTGDTYSSSKESVRRIYKSFAINKKSFDKVKNIGMQTIGDYSKAYELTKKYELRIKQADIWMKILLAAKKAKEDSWIEIAKFQIKNLVTTEDFERYYKKNIEKLGLVIN